MLTIGVKNYTPAVSREIREDGVIIFRVSSTNRDAIDAWKDACIETNRLLDPTKTSRTMHCVEDITGLITPYAHQRIWEVIRDSEMLRGYTAVVVHRSLTVALIETIWRHLERFHKAWDMKVFFHENGALQWLLERPDL
jgi:hypothetical protein